MSDKKLMADINASIEQHLPTQVGKALQGRLKDLEAAELTIINLEGLLKTAKEKAHADSIKISDLQVLVHRHAEVDKREAAVQEREIKATIVELNTKLEAETASKDFAEKVALGLVRNTEYRRNKMGQVPLREKYADGQVYNTSVQADFTETDSAA